jgi:hypothetical protein
MRPGHGDAAVYADLVATGAAAEQQYPGIGAPAPCGPCGEEIEGLLAAVRGDAD